MRRTVFERDEGGPNNWGLVKRITETTGLRDLTGAAIDGDTLMLGGGFDFSPVYVFTYQRNRGGPNAWGRVAEYRPPGVSVSFRLDGDKAVLTMSSSNEAHVLARNQGGQDAWGLVSRFKLADSRGLSWAALSAATQYGLTPGHG